MTKHLQNKQLKMVLLALLLGLSGTTCLVAQQTEGAIRGLFTVNSNGDRIVFSQGNLQYIGSAETPYWKFANHQWDVLGTSTGQNSSDPSVDRDLFGWGTSGYNHGAVCYQPWSTSENVKDYLAYGNETMNLFDETGQADWGYNPIINGGNQYNQWHTISEWDYLYIAFDRTTSSGILFAKARVNDVNGMILLPDNWNADYYMLNNTNQEGAHFNSNIITATQWSVLEQHGAVFLPAAGERIGTSIGGVDYFGNYWSPESAVPFEPEEFQSITAIYFDNGSVSQGAFFGPRSYGFSIRLIRSARDCFFGINATPNPIEGGVINGVGSYLGNAECTLTATPSQGYEFANWTINGVVVSMDDTYTFNVDCQDWDLVANYVMDANITFADANVKDLCVAPATGWDTNGDGELSYAEAAIVTSIGTVFKGNANIQSFNELEHFISLTAIDEQAFRNCSNLAEITIPEHVASIGSRAFWNCPALATVHFNAINCTSMYNVINEENHSVFMSSLTSHPLTNLTIGNSVQHIPDYAFRGCNQIQSLDIPASVTTVGDHAFYGCTSLETLTIGVDTIGEYAFYGCTSLEELTLGEGVAFIGSYAFCDCTNLEILTIGGGEIDGFGFYGCTSLEELTIGEGVTSIGGSAFWNCPTLTTVHFNATNCRSMRSDYSSVFARPITKDNNSTSIVTLTIGDSVTNIPDYAFYQCNGLTGNLVLPNSLTTIGERAFCDCSGFTGNLVLPNSVTTIGNSAFYGCSGFTGSLTISNSVTSIGESAFSNCSGFTGSLIIPNSVTSIEEGAFLDCMGFNGSLVIPNSVTTIGSSAFAWCIGFTALITESLAVPTAVVSYGHPFGSMNYAIPVYVPAGKVSEYQNAAGWDVFTNYKSQINFVPDENDQWSDDFNWSSWEVPGAEDVVCITGSCQLDMDAEVLYVYMRNEDNVLTLNSGHTLNTTYGVHSENASQLVIEDGAQLYNPRPLAQGTVKKHIEGYGTENGGYYLIANPVQDTLSPANLGMTTGSYDLYRFDQSQDQEWRNYKQNSFILENGTGYLYANSADTDIAFSGILNPTNADISLPLVSDANADDFEGWNLLGNPYTCIAYVNKPFYTLNNEGSEIVSVVFNSVESREGIFVIAAEDGDSLTFTTTAPEITDKGLTLNLSRNNGGGITTLRHAQGSTTAVIDRAIIHFGEGEQLPKFQLNPNSTKLYIPLEDKDYAVVNAEAQGELPVNFKAKENGSYMLSLSTENVDINYLHLIDNITGNDVDLLATPNYTFESKTTDYASRFRLVFSIICEDADGDNEVFAYISNGNIVVTDAEAGAMLQMVDVTGRVIAQGDAMNRVSTNGMTSGVYVLRLVSGDNVKTQKIVVK